MQDDMATGYTYQRDFVRLTERELALKTVEKSHKLIAEKQKLVDEGKARWVKKPISKGFILHLEMIE
jgi:hypothetical protein